MKHSQNVLDRIRKCALALSLINIVILLCLTTRFAWARKERLWVETANPSVVKLYMGNGGMCTGFVVGDGLIASAAHCLPDYITPETGAVIGLARFISGEETPVSYISSGVPEGSRDWLLLKASTFGVPALAPADPLDMGSKPPIACVSLGYDGGEVQKTMPCFVTGTQTIEDGGTFLTLLDEVDRGDSGGPVLGRDGRVLGIVVAMSRFDDRLGFAVPVWVLQEAIAQYDLQISIPQ